MSRFIAYTMIVLGIGLLGAAAYDEHRGIARPARLMLRQNGITSSRRPVHRDENPKIFRGAMTYEWILAVAVTGGGFVILGLCRRADRLDPFSPDFAGDVALDEWSQTLKGKEGKRPTRLE